MADDAPPSMRRRKKTAKERREQQVRSDSRAILRLLRGLSLLGEHRGSRLGNVGTALRTALQARPEVVPPVVQACSPQEVQAHMAAVPVTHENFVQPDVVVCGTWELLPESLDMLSFQTFRFKEIWVQKTMFHNIAVGRSDQAVPCRAIVLKSSAIVQADISGDVVARHHVEQFFEQVSRETGSLQYRPNDVEVQLQNADRR